MNLRFIDWIWHVRGSLALAPGQSSDDAFDRLDPLFRQTGTSRERTSGQLVFHKKDQAAQDKMSIFDGGVLKVERGATSSILHYDLASRILLFCFLLPLFFVGMGQLTIALGNYQQSSAKAAGKGSAAKKPAAKKPDIPMNPLDKALGAPAPERPKKDAKDKPDEEKKKPSPTPAYVFAAIFAILYVVGRIMEDRLVKSLFRRRLLGS